MIEFTKYRRGTGGHSGWVEGRVQRLRSIIFHRKPLNSPGLEAGEAGLWGEEGERLAKALEVVRRSLGFI